MNIIIKGVLTAFHMGPSTAFAVLPATFKPAFAALPATFAAEPTALFATFPTGPRSNFVIFSQFSKQ